MDAQREMQAAAPTGGVGVAAVAPDGAVQEVKPIAEIAPDPGVAKVVVAVHGVGDQQSYATLQAVVNQFCGYFQQPAGIPLGSFHTGDVTFSVPDPWPTDRFGRLAFAEVYWADVPRAIVAERHTIEESKKWAATIVERLRLRWHGMGKPDSCREADFVLLKQVLGEMIQTIGVLERLTFLAEKAGLFTFDLRELLDDYLGDVQVVAEFRSERKKILDKFGATMRQVHEKYPKADIFLVAHSEGTVVSFLGLLEALRLSPRPAWASRVRGFMTLGSPIDKHLALWPELFAGGAPAGPLESPIEWRNYYDRGDPVGFDLDDARRWLAEQGWGGVFAFREEDDIGFVRYPFPGKAHVDYWLDADVFGHFIETVVKESAAPANAAGGASRYARAPGDRWVTKVMSTVMPYVGVAALIAVGVYVLYKTVVGAVYPDARALESTAVLARTVAAITLLLLGVTVVARVPRLTRRWSLRAMAVGAAAACAMLYRVVQVPGDGGNAPDYALWAIVLAAAVSAISALRPTWGLKPLIGLGVVAVAGIVYATPFRFEVASGETAQLWPVVLAVAAFSYLWWLAALIFDLVFVWHVHIRQSLVLRRMGEMGGRREAGAAEAAVPAPAAG